MNTYNSMQTRAGREKAKGAAQWKSFSAKAGAELREAGKGLKPGCLKLGIYVSMTQ